MQKKDRGIGVAFIVVILAFIGAGGYFLFSSDKAYNKEEVMEKTELQKGEFMMEKEVVGEVMMEKDTAGDLMMKKEGEPMVSYQGDVLAGTDTPYIEFNKTDYEKALAQNKIVLLYFYAKWCPTRRAEQPEIFEAFNSLNNNNIVGFRVNYKDNDTDEFETALAKEFGVAYQHTKVILKNGVRVGKYPDTWDKDRYLSEITKLTK